VSFGALFCCPRARRFISVIFRFDLDNETETIKNYRKRVKQAEAVGHFALAEQLRKIISQEQEHQHDLATALGIDVPDVLSEGA
jgi:bacterioferritin